MGISIISIVIVKHLSVHSGMLPKIQFGIHNHKNIITLIATSAFTIAKRAKTMSGISSSSSRMPMFASALSTSQMGNTSNKNVGGSKLVSSSLKAATSTSTSESKEHPLADLLSRLDNSWMRQLHPETESNRIRSLNSIGIDVTTSATKNNMSSSNSNTQYNNMKRPIHNGHYIPITPSPLTDPRLVMYSKDVAQSLGLWNNNDNDNDNKDSNSIHSKEFVSYVSGNIKNAFDELSNEEDDNNAAKVQPWVTPYALSIMGTRYVSNCPFGTGDGYGDGRASSIGEFLTIPRDETTKPQQHPPKYELQLKGSGPTPFCRGADGRAVFRSSMREFLASEAMHHLHVSTTRALSLVVSQGGDFSQRAWYNSGKNDRFGGGGNGNQDITLDDPRLAKYPIQQRRLVLAQIRAQRKDDPNIMVREINAITCRAARSFVRIGHFDLFARRVVAGQEEMGQKGLNPIQKLQQMQKGSGGNGNASSKAKPEVDSLAFRELEALMWHACYREYPEDCYHPFHTTTSDNTKEHGENTIAATKILLQKSMYDISTTVSNWIKVGFVQGNFNADNCLIAGRTMDYGPFGFIDEYHPLSAKWTGSGDHFGFLNQPEAGLANFGVLVESLIPILEGYSDDSSTNNNSKGWKEEVEKYADTLMEEARIMFKEKLLHVIRNKMGFSDNDPSADLLWTGSVTNNDGTNGDSEEGLEVLLRESRADWTVFWRQLTYVARDVLPEGADAEDLLIALIGEEQTRAGSSPFYVVPEGDVRERLIGWMGRWREAVLASNNNDVDIESGGGGKVAYERMKLVNPKYVLRENLLVEAYEAADPGVGNAGGTTNESKMHNLLELILDPYEEGTAEQHEKYYRRAPDSALTEGGTAFMS